MKFIYFSLLFQISTRGGWYPKLKSDNERTIHPEKKYFCPNASYNNIINNQLENVYMQIIDCPT